MILPSMKGKLAPIASTVTGRGDSDDLGTSNDRTTLGRDCGPRGRPHRPSHRRVADRVITHPVDRVIR